MAASSALVVTETLVAASSARTCSPKRVVAEPVCPMAYAAAASAAGSSVAPRLRGLAVQWRAPALNVTG